MVSRAAFPLVILCHVFSSAPAWPAQPVPLIGMITIQTMNVYSPPEASRGWLYRAVNALHFRTKTSIVRKFLLFKEGDPFDPYLLTGSERNLRSLGFLKSATVTAQPSNDSIVNVDVTTQDSWTTELGFSFGVKGGKTVYGLQLKEKSLFGTGRALFFDYDKQLDRTTRSILYRDPMVFGAYWTGELGFAWKSDGWEKTALIERPFYSFATTWGLRTAFDDLRQTGWIYQDALAVSGFQQAHTQFQAQWGISLLATQTAARRLVCGFESDDDRFSPTPDRPDDILPQSRKVRYLTVGYEDTENGFLKLNYVNRDQRFEDFNLGRQFSVQAAISPSAFGVPTSTLRLSATGQTGFQLAPGAFQLTNISFETRWDRRPSNEILTVTAGCVVKFESPVIQTTVARLQFTQGWNLDRDRQFFADEETGLRAYRSHVFAGDMTLLGNLEHRIFWGHELLQLVSPGLAVFGDIGAAGLSGHWRSMRFVTDVGVGLRLGLPRAAQHNIIRVDFGYALSPDPLGRRGWLISIGESQAF